jgi:hypothetical protein
MRQIYKGRLEDLSENWSVTITLWIYNRIVSLIQFAILIYVSYYSSVTPGIDISFNQSTATSIRIIISLPYHVFMESLQLKRRR